jgi:hypothetical protein
MLTHLLLQAFQRTADELLGTGHALLLIQYLIYC